jgi:hypothetical protein
MMEGKFMIFRVRSPNASSRCWVTGMNADANWRSGYEADIRIKEQILQGILQARIVKLADAFTPSKTAWRYGSETNIKQIACSF